jgi:hypothetical protein
MFLAPFSIAFDKLVKGFIYLPFNAGLGNFNMLVSNDLFRHGKIGLGK